MLSTLDHLGLARAHVCGLSMGGYATLIFGHRHPDRARSLTVAGCGFGGVGADRAAFRDDALLLAQRFETDTMAPVADFYSRGAHTRAVHRQGSVRLAGVSRPAL